MKIIVEGQSIVGKPTGIGKMTENLIRAVTKISDDSYTLCVFGSPSSLPQDLPIKKFGIPRKIYASLFRMGINIPYNWLSGKADIYIFPNYTKYPTTSGKSILFIHDLTYIKYPETVEPKNLSYLRSYLPRFINEADHLVTISEASKKDIIKEFGIADNKISVIYPASSNEAKTLLTDQEVEEIKKKFSLKDYILFVGTLEPRKNLPRLLKAFEILAPKYPELKLVLVGSRAWKSEEFDQAFASNKFKDKVVIPGYISDQELACLYRGANVFAFPSLYEGFGIPILEAFSYRVPVVTSNVSSIPEVVGDAGILVDPLNIEELSKSLSQVLENKNLQDELVSKGRRQLEKFSWEISANKLISITKSL